jgi:hypothetical protein
MASNWTHSRDSPPNLKCPLTTPAQIDDSFTNQIMIAATLKAAPFVEESLTSVLLLEIGLISWEDVTLSF